MSLIIGRFGVDEVSGEVQSVSDDGRRVSLRCVTAYADSSLSAAVLRQQLLGYVESADERFVPVLWDAEPEFAGYYRVLAASFSGVQGSATQGVWSFTVDLERVQGFAAPLIELHTLGKTRTGTHGQTPTQSICVPDVTNSVAFYARDTGSYVPFSPNFVRSSETGDVKVYTQLASVPWLTQYYVEPDRFYDGAASLYMGDSASLVVGRQVANTPEYWMLSNGIFQIQGDSTGGLFGMRMRMWLSGAWSDWLDVGFRDSDTSALEAPHSIAVLKNTPDEVVVRLLATAGAGSSRYSPTTVDVSLKRGSRYASVELQSVFTSTFRLRPPQFSAATQDEPWYLWKTIGPVRMVIASPYTIEQISTDVFPFQDAVTSVTEWSFMLGVVDAAAAVTAEGIIGAGREYLFACSTRQAVVAL